MTFQALAIPITIVRSLWLSLLFVAVPILSRCQDYHKVPREVTNVHISKSTYDYTGLANEITAGCTDNLQKIAAIYQWICDSIAYDTSYRVHTADDCLKMGRGTCQGYCELFYQLARVVEVKVEIISGLSKNSKGEVNLKGHSWLFAYTSDDQGILLDPTWGAGSVIDGVFQRSPNCWLWFNVDPDWLILSHWPRNATYQLQEQRMSESEFRSAMPVNELWLEYGLDAHKLALAARAGTLDIPKFYNGGEGDFSVVDIPLRRSLKMGENYNFRIRVKSGREFAIINNKTRCIKEQWTLEADSSYSVSFMPRETGTLSIGLRDTSGSGWKGMVSYEIEAPTAEDWARVEETDPLSAPELKRIKNLHAEKWDSAGVSARELLRIVRAQNIERLPTIYTNKGQRLTIVSVPMNQTLKAGEPYTFSFYPRSGVKWALKNNTTMHTDWQIGEDNLHTMTITPAQGNLFLFVKMQEGEGYWSSLKYDVE